MDDFHAPHTYARWQPFIDTLEAHGVEVDFTTDLGFDINVLLDFDVVWIIHPRRPLGGNYIKSLRNYLRSDNKKIVMWHAPDPLPLNYEENMIIGPDAKLLDTIPLSILDSYISYFDFPPLTDGIDHYFDDRPVEIGCGDKAYPIIFDDSAKTVPICAIIYPYIDKGICNYILILTGTHNFEMRIYDTLCHVGDSSFYLIGDSLYYKIGDYTLLVAANVSGFELRLCSVPEPYQISVTSIPHCANPGDTVRICGRNLWRGKTESLGGDIEIYIGATEPVPHEYDTIVIPIRYSQDYTGDSTWLEFIMPDLPPGTYPIRLGHKAITFDAGEITVPCPMHADIIPECADPGDVITISGENLIGPISITMGDSVVSAVSYSEDRSKVAFRCPWLPRGQYQVNLSWHDMFVASGMIEIPCPHRCERFPNPITPNFDAINDFAQFEFDGIFVKPARIHIFDIHGHEIRTIDVPAGLFAKQHARWDGTDDGGNPVPEGVYIYTIEVACEVVCEGTVTVAR